MADPPPEALFVPPTLFDGFAVEGPLGRGGMGHVYLGRDVALDRSVALKFVASREGSTTALERFRREARAIARLSHQNVVSIFRIGEVSGHPYIAYEFVSGKSLDRTAMPLPWQIVLRIAVGVSRGLEAVHRAGILHRDVKPANIILSDAGEIKLIDFGLASLVANADDPPEPAPSAAKMVPPVARTVDDLHLTSPGTVLGTPAYIAPEIWCGEAASSRSDVFALGMTLYQMLTGELPHAALPFEELFRFILLRDMPTLRARRPDVPESLVAIIERCLKKDPLERFADGTELREILETTERIFLPAGGSALQALVLEPNHVAVASSFTRVRSTSSAFARTIYDRLFSRAPALRELFPSDMSAQEKKLLHMIDVAIDALSNPNSLDDVLADLGRRHVHYGARVEHFAPLWAALIEALEHHEGEAWTPELASAWKHALALLEERMRRGMAVEKPTLVSSAKNVLRASPPLFGVRPSSPTPTDWRPPRTQYARSGPIDIAYQSFGDGNVDLVLLMGWLSHLELNWGHTSLMSFLEALGRFARVVVYDKRGTGLSVRTPETATVDDHIDDLLLVCDEAGLANPVLFGAGDGGSMAVLAAALHPDRFSDLVLYGATPKMTATEEFAGGLSDEAFASIEAQIRSRWGEAILLDTHAPSMADDSEFHDWLALYMRMSASPQLAWSMMSQSARRDLRPVLPHVSASALVMHRAGDRAVPIAGGRYLAEHLPGATFVELKGDDHLVWVGDTEELLRSVRGFVSRARKDTALTPPLRLVAAYRGPASVERAAAELAAMLGGASLGDVDGVRAFSFSRGRGAAVFLQRLAVIARGASVELTCGLDALPLKPGDEAAAVRAATSLVDIASPDRAPLSALAVSLLSDADPGLSRSNESATLELVANASAA